MTSELTRLTATALITAPMWAPYIPSQGLKTVVVTPPL
jgi:hypothetical protein